MATLTRFPGEIFRKDKKPTGCNIFVTHFYGPRGAYLNRSLEHVAEIHAKYKYLPVIVGAQTANYDEFLAECLSRADKSRYERTMMDELDQYQSELYELSLAEKNRLEAKVRFLEAELRSDRPYSQLYKLGAGSLFVALISLVFWGLTGIGAPFHPIFAATVAPASIGIVVMAFLVRRNKKQEKPSEKNV